MPWIRRTRSPAGRRRPAPARGPSSAGRRPTSGRTPRRRSRRPRAARGRGSRGSSPRQSDAEDGVERRLGPGSVVGPRPRIDRNGMTAAEGFTGAHGDNPGADDREAGRRGDRARDRLGLPVHAVRRADDDGRVADRTRGPDRQERSVLDDHVAQRGGIDRLADRDELPAGVRLQRWRRARFGRRRDRGRTGGAARSGARRRGDRRGRSGSRRTGGRRLRDAGGEDAHGERRSKESRAAPRCEAETESGHGRRTGRCAPDVTRWRTPMVPVTSDPSPDRRPSIPGQRRRFPSARISRAAF